MRAPLISLHLPTYFPEAAALLESYAGLKERLAVVRREFKEHPGNSSEDREAFVDAIEKVFTEHEPAATMLLEYWGVDGLSRPFIVEMLLRDRLPEYPLQQACDDLMNTDPATSSPLNHANMAATLLVSRAHTVPLQFGCEINPRRMHTFFGYLLAAAVQHRLGNLGTAATTRRLRLETTAAIISHYVNETGIHVGEANWRELIMVYMANAID